MLKWSFPVSLGSVTVWACSFLNISVFQFLHQANRDNHTVKNLHSWLSEVTFPFLSLRKAITPASQWLISRNLGGAIAKKTKTKTKQPHAGGFYWTNSQQRKEYTNICPLSLWENWTVVSDPVPMRHDDWELIQNSRSPLSYWTMPLYSGVWSTVGMCQNGRHHSEQKCSENPGNYLWGKKPGRWCHRPSYTTRGLATAQS